MGQVWVTGDIHGNPSKRLNTDNFPDQKEMTKDDYVIILGDFGLVWDYTGENSREKYWLDWLEKKPFTTLFIDGNHENFSRLNNYPVEEWHGGRVHKIRPSVIHLMRGEVFDICGKKFFAFGGASSHDIKDGILDPDDYVDDDAFKKEVFKWDLQWKQYRIKGMSWWPEELPSDEEMNNGKVNLNKVNHDVNYVVTHSLPQEIASIISAGKYEQDRITRYFNELLQDGLEFKEWRCGHYHMDKRVLGKFYIMYWDLERML